MARSLMSKRIIQVCRHDSIRTVESGMSDKENYQKKQRERVRRRQMVKPEMEKKKQTKGITEERRDGVKRRRGKV